MKLTPLILVLVASASSVYSAPVPQPEPGIGEFVNGAFNGVKDMVSGVANMVLHPIDTVKGIGKAVLHPVDTAKALGNSIKKTYKEKGLSYVLGHGMVDAAGLVMPMAGGLGKANALANSADDIARAAATAGNAALNSVDEVAKAGQIGATAASFGDEAATVGSALANNADDVGKVGGLANNVDDLGNVAQINEKTSMMSRAADKGRNAVNNVKQSFNGISNDVRSGFGIMKDKATGMFQGGKQGAAGFADEASSMGRNARELFAETSKSQGRLAATREFAGNAMTGIKDGATRFGGAVRDGAANAFNGVKNAAMHPMQTGRAAWGAAKANPYIPAGVAIGLGQTANLGRNAGSDEDDWSQLAAAPVEAVQAVGQGIEEFGNNGGQALEDGVNWIAQ